MLSFHNKSINLGEILPRSTSRCSTDRVKALFQESRDLYRLHNKILSQGQTVNIARETPETPELEMHITKLRVEFPKRVSNATEGTQIDDSLILGDDKDTLEMPRIESPSVFLKK